MSNLRNKIIRLAHENPELRKDLLPLLKEARSGHGFDHEGKDFAVTISSQGGRGLSAVTLYWPLENIGIMRRKIQIRRVLWGYEQGRTSRTAWPETILDRLKRASNINSAMSILDKNIKEMKGAESFYYWEDKVKENKAWDKTLPVPSRLIIEDIKGGDVYVSMNGQTISFNSKSDNEKWMNQGYQIYDLDVHKRFQKKVNSVRDLLEKARGYDAIEKILDAAKIPFKTFIRIHPMYS
tara:strand:- start:306 stop:1019 length:714 start_codon:yes stop_codon:yes gene_type:complete